MLYIMRHGKTKWNAEHRLQGKTDVPLSEEGRQMAAEAGDACRDIHLDLCFSSPLIRARETAALFLKDRKVPILIDERLSEMGFGIFEGTRIEKGAESRPIDVLFEAPESYTTPVEGGESLASLYARTGAFLEETVRPLLKEGKDILIVGHGAMNSCIICQIRKEPVSQFWSAGIENCRMMRLL